MGATEGIASQLLQELAAAAAQINARRATIAPHRNPGKPFTATGAHLRSGRQPPPMPSTPLTSHTGDDILLPLTSAAHFILFFAVINGYMPKDCYCAGQPPYDIHLCAVCDRQLSQADMQKASMLQRPVPLVTSAVGKCIRIGGRQQPREGGPGAEEVELVGGTGGAARQETEKQAPITAAPGRNTAACRRLCGRHCHTQGPGANPDRRPPFPTGTFLLLSVVTGAQVGLLGSQNSWP